ncbi:MAG TPA: hypothetical protein VE093_23065 [Polyangiaceae bacterium]|jgi:hypothetical protein|nr:hypothetical protein [Polyangiaceae bacterium]
MSDRPPRPGLAKVKTAPILKRRSAELIAALGGRILELVETASVISEGQARREGGEVVYYGTTSLLFPRRSLGGSLPDESAADLAVAFENDPHARLHIVRIAHREASSRASGQLGPVQAELRVEVTPRGVVVLVDVAAPVLRKRLKSTAL